MLLDDRNLGYKHSVCKYFCSLSVLMNIQTYISANSKEEEKPAQVLWSDFFIEQNHALNLHHNLCQLSRRMF